MKVEYSRTATTVEISTFIPSRLSGKIPEIMERSGIKSLGIGGGTGWSIDCHQGPLLIILPLYRTKDIGEILSQLSLLAPEFQTGDKILADHRQGALP